MVESKGVRYVINQGGSRSGKTYSILQYLIGIAFRMVNAGLTITVCRKTLNALKATAERDFLGILKNEGLYNEKYHNRTDRTYDLNGNMFEFIGLDDSQKVRGRKRDILFINEANDVDEETFTQLNMRTTTKVIIDFNPSEEFWAEDLKKREDSRFYITTHLDNPFLPDVQRQAIEDLKHKDPAQYQIYALGLFAELQGVIYRNKEQALRFPDTAKSVCYALDFGFSNDVTALVRCGLFGGEIYAQELIYETGMTNTDISKRLAELGVRKRLDEIIADTGNGGAMNIEELKRMGWNIRGAKKGPGSIKYGISVMQRYKLNLIGDNIWKEAKNYVWMKDVNGKPLDEPIDRWNHALDALRYWAMEKAATPQAGVRRSFGGAY